MFLPRLAGSTAARRIGRVACTRSPPLPAGMSASAREIPLQPGSDSYVVGDMTPSPTPSAPSATDKTLGELEQAVMFAVLHLQRVDEELCYSMGIRDEIERRAGRRVAPGALYTVLDRLEGHGYVRGDLGPSTPKRGGRRKKLFRLEPAGVDALARSVDRFRGMSRGLLGHLDALRPHGPSLEGGS